MKVEKKGYLILETGESFHGLWRGGVSRAGEVVFNTSHSGYEEMSTDPSYYSQILVLTASMQGNYGADRSVWESRKPWIHGFVCLQLQETTRENSWLEVLRYHNIPVLTDFDTRKLVLRLRDLGTTWGALVMADDEAEAKVMADKLISQEKAKGSDWVQAVTRNERESFAGEKSDGPKVAVIDYGVKDNILRELKKRTSEVSVWPARSQAEDIKAWQPDAILLSNGPGDPEQVEVAVGTIRELIGWRPIFGICMGHQLLSLALGAKTHKIKFGHRGGNHPVKDLRTGRVYVTSQNHGYAVSQQSLPDGVEVTHLNLNDQTIEGIKDTTNRCFSVQFHPESHPGPNDARSLFDEFIGMLA